MNGGTPPQKSTVLTIMNGRNKAAKSGSSSSVLSGFDKGSDEGDRSGLSIYLTREQHAALMRADLPPGDSEGIRLKQENAEVSQP